jgi:hypothetical protein
MENKKRNAGSHASEAHKLTHKEAGHLGGVAHHKCRGRECGENKSHAGRSASHSVANKTNKNEENNH